jgi:hypothetical protein
VCGFVKWHGIGVAVVITWNAVAALIALAVGRKKRKAAAASLLSAFAGWCVAFLVLVVWNLPRVHPPGSDTLDEWMLLPGMFAFLAWVLFALPVVASARADGLLYRPWFAPIVGTGLALAAYAILVCPWAHDDRVWQMIWFPAIIGAVAGILFPLVARSRCPAYLLLSGPSIVLLSFWCLLWPLLENLTPDLTYRYGTPDVRARSLHRILQSIRVGDSTTELRRRHPVLSSLPVAGMQGGGSTDRYEYRYEIGIDRATGCVKSVSSELSLREHRDGEYLRDEWHVGDYHP